MHCPSCRKEFHSDPDEVAVYLFDTPKDKNTNAFCFTIELCPSCNSAVVIYQEGNAKSDGSIMTKINFSEVIFPLKPNSVLSNEIPDEYKDEYMEAYTALQYSPKASAALSRRLLQKLLEQKNENTKERSIYRNR